VACRWSLVYYYSEAALGLVNGVKYAGEEFAHLAANWNQRPDELTNKKDRFISKYQQIT
jgi:hypothetical protein